MKNEHTPGPLYFSEGSTPHHQGQISSEASGHTLAVTYNDEGGHNGRLYAAAPDLLEALEGFIHSVENEGAVNGRVCCAVENARAAIEKATGN